MANQEFEIVKHNNLADCEIKTRNKIKDYNERGYKCISHSMMITRAALGGSNYVISLLFEPYKITPFPGQVDLSLSQSPSEVNGN